MNNRSPRVPSSPLRRGPPARPADLSTAQCKEIVAMCGASPLNLPPDAASYLIGHNIAPAAVKSRLEELATVPDIIARHGFTARLPELMDIALRFDENRAQGVGALLLMVLEDSQPVIYTNLPTGPAVRRGPSLVNTKRSFRP